MALINKSFITIKILKYEVLKMLKIKEFVCECEDFKIKNPDKETKIKINNELQKYGNMEAEFDNPKLLLYLFRELVISDNVDFQFDKYSLGNFTDLLEDERTPKEFNEIVFHIGDIVNDIVMDTLRAQLMQIKNLEMTTSQAKILNEINKIGKEKDKIENEGIEVNVEKIGFIDKILIKLGLKEI